MSNPTVESRKKEMADGKTAAARALPRLVAQRDEMEKEAGSLGVAKQRQMVVFIAVGAVAGIAGAYSMWVTMTADPPVIAWVVTIVLGAIVGFLVMRTKRTEGARVRHLDELHTKMHTVGRRIDGAERKLRD